MNAASSHLAVAVGALALTLGACSAEPAPPTPIWPSDFATSLSVVRGCRLSPAEHDGFYIQVFADDVAKQPYLDHAAALPAGALVVKGEYDDATCSKLVRVSAMRREATGSAPATKDWTWQRGSAAGVVDEDAAVPSCVGCHTPCKGRDYLCTEP